MTEEPETHLARLLRDHRRTQAWLARQAGVDRQEVWRLAHGKRRMNEDWARKLAPHLNVPWTELLQGRPLEQLPGGVEHGVGLWDTIPKIGDPIKDLDEAALVWLYRRQSYLKKIAMLIKLGFDEVPSVAAAKGEPIRLPSEWDSQPNPSGRLTDEA